MKKYDIPYFFIGKTPGGNQDWFTDWWMNVGGCAALAACDICICLSKNHNLYQCCPFSTEHITVSEYVEFGMKMKPYIRPRVGGVTRLSIFTNGLKKYLCDQGVETEFKICPGKCDVEEAKQFLKDFLQKNMPVAFLLLRHKNEKYKDLIWHWFMITGYDETGESFIVHYHTYGGRYKINFTELWNTGFYKKGGMAAVKSVKTITGDNLPEA